MKTITENTITINGHKPMLGSSGRIEVESDKLKSHWYLTLPIAEYYKSLKYNLK